MKNRNKKVLFALMLGCSITLMATGCDKLKKEPETETEAPTEAPTEKQTETETESETQPQNLTAEEELAQAKEYDQLKSLYAKDDINVRTKPGTDDSSEIFSSFAQGDQIVVVGETPNWYEVDVDGYEEHGYVSKPVSYTHLDVYKRQTYHIWKRYPQYLRKQFWKEHTFWTDGYFACSVGNVSEEMLKRYIGNQG